MSANCFSLLGSLPDTYWDSLQTLWALPPPMKIPVYSTKIKRANKANIYSKPLWDRHRCWAIIILANWSKKYCLIFYLANYGNVLSSQLCNYFQQLCKINIFRRKKLTRNDTSELKSHSNLQSQELELELQWNNCNKQLSRAATQRDISQRNNNHNFMIETSRIT